MFNESPIESPIEFIPVPMPDGSPRPVDAEFVRASFDKLGNQRILRLARGDTGLFLDVVNQKVIHMDVTEVRERDPELFAALRKNEIDIATALHQAALAKQSPEAQLENAIGLRNQAREAEPILFERPLRVAQILSSNSTEIYPREQTAPMEGQVSAITPTRISFISDQDDRERHILRTHCVDEDKLHLGDKIKFDFKNGKATPTVTEKYVSPEEKRLLATVEQPGVMRIARTPQPARGARAG